MRASDADRDIVLGELPVLLEDLVPQTALVRRAGVPDTATMQEQAVARWERSRGEAFMGFLIPTLICWVVWLVTVPGGFVWPVFPMIGTAIPLVRVLVQRKEIIASNERRIVRRQDKELRRQQRKQLPPPDDR